MYTHCGHAKPHLDWCGGEQVVLNYVSTQGVETHQLETVIAHGTLQVMPSVPNHPLSIDSRGASRKLHEQVLNRKWILNNNFIGR
jgi:hypothetical protein